MSTSKEVPSQGTLFDTSVSWSSTEPYSIPRIVFGGQPSAGILDSAERSEAVAGPVSIDSARLVIALLDDISQKRRLQGLVIADPRSASVQKYAKSQHIEPQPVSDYSRLRIGEQEQSMSESYHRLEVAYDQVQILFEFCNASLRKSSTPRLPSAEELEARYYADSSAGAERTKAIAARRAKYRNRLLNMIGSMEWQ